jgi:ubiquinone/menaquinone biosynthesis C-methylase UbiE
MKSGLIVEPPIFKEFSKLAIEMQDKTTLPNVVKYVILNREAYEELINYYKEWYDREEYPDTLMDHPIVLDVDAKERIRLISNCCNEYRGFLR